MPRLLADITPLRESPAFRRLYIGTALSAIGTQLTIVAVSLQIYSLTQSTLSVGLLSLFALVPLVVAGLYGGAIADAQDRRKVALYSGFALWATTMAIAAQAWIGVDSVWLLYALIAIQSGAAGINQPTRSSIIPRLVRPELLPAANALSMITFGLAFTVGPLLAGLLVAQVGYAWTYTVDVVTFTFALWAVFRLPALPPEGSHPPGRARDRPRGLPLPRYAAEHPHDIHPRPDRHDHLPAAGAAARRRSGAHRRGRADRRHPARLGRVRLGAGRPVLRTPRPDPQARPGRDLVHRRVGCVRGGLRTRGRHGELVGPAGSR
ncbi:hypothetical protein MN0502_26400 [Arthrobacter sp. MN05-02]|nr:hypothetical protein MN0502_26400 [Arthrobacter sp. MN05-02]